MWDWLFAAEVWGERRRDKGFDSHCSISSREVLNITLSAEYKLKFMPNFIWCHIYKRGYWFENEISKFTFNLEVTSP